MEISDPKKYFARIDGEQKGPFSLRQLIDAGVRPSTYVWAKGMADWQHADEVPDICRAMRRRLAGLDILTGEEIPRKPSTPAEDQKDPQTSSEDFIPTSLRSIGESGFEPDYSLKPQGVSIAMAVAVTILCFPVTGMFAIYFAARCKTFWKRQEDPSIRADERRELQRQAHDEARKYKMAVGITFSFGLMLMGLTFAGLFSSCRHDVVIPGEKPTPTPPPSIESPETPTTLYLLNEGNMGMNKCSLSKLDISSGEFENNVYQKANPGEVMDLGDVGTCMAINGDKLWIAVNCSNKVEVLRASDAVKVTHIDIPNCRYIAFDDKYAYVTSYAGPVIVSEDYDQLGFVARINLQTLQLEGRCIVGFQPDGIVVSNGKIYVANSGGYRVPNYENRLSVIDAATFEVEKEVEVGINLNRVIADSEGKIWISSRGDYFNTQPALYCYDPAEDEICADFQSLCANAMWLDEQSGILYCVGTYFNYLSGDNVGSYHTIDTYNCEFISSSWPGGSEFSKIKTLYGVAVDPASKEIYLTDAGNYVNPGWLYRYSADGTFIERYRAGDVPSAIVFH